jgi:hypothetical protein
MSHLERTHETFSHQCAELSSSYEGFNTPPPPSSIKLNLQKCVGAITSYRQTSFSLVESLDNCCTHSTNQHFLIISLLLLCWLFLKLASVFTLSAWLVFFVLSQASMYPCICLVGHFNSLKLGCVLHFAA